MAGGHNGEATAARGGFLSGVARRWRWIVGGTLAGLAASAALVAFVPPRFVAVATALIGAPAAAADDEGAGAQSIASTDLARAAVERLGLAANPEFAGDPGHDAANAFLARLHVTASPGSRTVRITFASRDPKLAAEGANMAAELAVQSLNEARGKAGRAAGTWLAEKIDDARARVAEADAKVEAARAEAGPTPGSGEPAGSKEASDVGAKLSVARAAEAAASGKAERMHKLERGGLEDAPAALADEPLKRLMEQRAALKAEIADVSRTLLPLHPRMKDLAAQLAALDGHIRVAAGGSAGASEAEARRAGEEAEALAKTLAGQSKSGAASAPGALLQGLVAEAQAAREELASYQQMAREDQARAAAAEADAARILTRASPPRAPDFPKIVPTVLAGAGTGFVLSTLAAVAAALATRGRRTGPLSDPEAQRVAAETTESAAPNEAAGASASEPALPAAMPVRAPDDAAGLAARLNRLKPRGNLVALVTGDRTGRALPVALETARALATERAAVLVDLGETQDWLADILYREETDEQAIPGLNDLIEGRAGFGAVIRRDLSTTLDVVLPGHGGPGGRIDDALTAFAAAYEAIVLHASDWRSDWVRSAAAVADTVVVVAPAARAEAALGAAEAALGDACPAFLAFAVRAERKALEPAE
jgi:uncharacterized protein involved in exopolysaccharide biosynthesis